MPTSPMPKRCRERAGSDRLSLGMNIPVGTYTPAPLAKESPMDILGTISTRRTPQSEQADPRQSRNAAGGYTFTPDDYARLHRFLTLGTDGGTYYTSAKDITRDNAEVVFRAAAS